MKDLGKKIDEMKRLYWDDKKSLRQVAEIMGCSNKGVEYQFKKHGIPLRTRSQSLKGRKISDKAKEVARQLGKSQVGEKNPRWKGKVERNGYIAVHVKEHPFKSKDGYVMEHRLVMEKELGRFLTKDEDVHHINENKKDNRAENLMVISKSEHSRMHGIERVKNGTHNNYIRITKEEMKKAIMNNETIYGVAKELNINKATVFKKIKKLNLWDWYQEWRNFK